MTIIWSDFASRNLNHIYIYYKETAGVKIAKRIKNSLFKSLSQLIKHPHSGSLEPTLISLNSEHRYLVVSNYKVIYKLVKEGILITDVFDTRQNPKLLNDINRLLTK